MSTLFGDAPTRQAKARLLAGGPQVDTQINRLRLSETDKWVAGICGGIGAITGVESWVWRLLFALTAFIDGSGSALALLLGLRRDARCEGDSGR